MGGEGDAEIYRVPVSGNAPLTQFSRNMGMYEYGSRYSPDGRRLVLVGDVNGNSDIYLIENMRTVKVQPLKRLTSGSSVEDHPEWHPRDEQLIAYLSEEGHNGTKDLWRMRRDGSGKRKIASSVQADEFSGFVWHPDGEYIFFVKDSGAEQDPICYVHVSTKQVFTLDTGTVLNRHINITADGTKIAFSARGTTGDKEYTWATIYYGDLQLR